MTLHTLIQEISISVKKVAQLHTVCVHYGIILTATQKIQTATEKLYSMQCVQWTETTRHT